jgi:hypothetical protein
MFPDSLAIKQSKRQASTKTYLPLAQKINEIAESFEAQESGQNQIDHLSEAPSD